MRRINDPSVINEALQLYPFGDININLDNWLSHPENIALSDRRGNVGLFEDYFPGVYTGHYFFHDRGKEAKRLAIAMLHEIFEKYNAEAIRGLTPVKHRAAIYMTRLLGFKDYGEVMADDELCVIFVMTKDEFTTRYKDN